MNRLLFILTLPLFLLSCNYWGYDKDRVLKIGHSLISIDTNHHQSPQIPDLVGVGPQLIEKLVFLRAHAKTYHFNVNSGDFGNAYGMGKADCILIIDTDFQDIGIRLRYNRGKNKYEILGFMTL